MEYLAIFGIFGLLLGLYAVFDLSQVKAEIANLQDEISNLKSGK